MATEQGTPFNLQDRVKLYAPLNAKYHTPGEEVNVGVNVAEKFKSMGYTTEKPKATKPKGGNE